MKEEKASSSSLAQPSPQHVISSSAAAGPGAAKHDELRDNNYSVEDDEELWKERKWCWERDYEKFPLNNNNCNENKIAVGIHNSNDEKKQPGVATTTTTTSSSSTAAAIMNRTIKTEKKDTVVDFNNNSVAVSATVDDEDNNDDNNDDNDNDNDNDSDYKTNVKYTDDVNIKHDSYYDDWVTGNWAYLNDDGDNSFGSRKRKWNAVVEQEENAVIVISDDQNILTKRKCTRPMTSDQTKSWANMFNKLVDYKKHHGHTMVSQKNSQHGQLGHWVNKQRMCHKNGELLESRCTLLNSIGLVWEDCQSIMEQEKWMKIYQRLVEYKHQYKHTMVPKNYQKDLKLGRWVRWQRSLNNTNMLLSNRYDLLQSISFVWEDSKSINEQEKWMKMYQQLVEYKHKHKTTLVSRRFKGGNKSPLGNWVSRQRNSNNRNKLLSNRYNLLQSIDFVWDATRTPKSHIDDDDSDGDDCDNDDDDNDFNIDDEKKPAAVVSTSNQSQIPIATITTTATATADNDNNNNEPNGKYADANDEHDSYYDDWVEGSWAFLNDDDNNSIRDSRKRKTNITEEENAKTRRNPKRQISLTPDQLKSWAKMFHKLVEYKKQHGNTMVPQRDKCNM